MPEIRAAGSCQVHQAVVYQRRRPERSVAYQVVQHCLETWLARRRAGRLDAGADWVVDSVPAYVERDLRKYLKFGILAHRFARVRCEKCGQDFLVAYLCKGRGVCAGCNIRRMVDTAAHMVEHVFPAVAVRQWVVVFPKHLRYFLNVDAGCLNGVAGIAMSEVQRATAGASTSTAKAARSGGVLFVHRFGATLNAHVHLHLCMPDGVVAQGRQGLAIVGRRWMKLVWSGCRGWYGSGCWGCLSGGGY